MSLSSQWGPSEIPTTALLTDHYELTMLRAALLAGTANRHSVFELFGRRLPPGRRYGVVCGVGRALRALRAFRFDEESLRFLLDTDVVDARTADWLADFRFSGDIWGYPEGEVYVPGSPLLIVDSTFAEGVVLETVLLSIYNHDSAIASAASRMTAMAGDRPCIEMGSRRTQELSAVAAARAAFIAGFEATSNLEAGRRYHVPTRGTSAHSFTLLHGDESEAFRAQIAALGEDTTLLVDTYDVMNAVRSGVELTGGRLGAVRLDSGDLPCWPPRCASCWTRSVPVTPRSSSPPTWTSGTSRPCPARPSTGTASAPPWSPAAATRPAGSSTSWWHGPTPTRRRPLVSVAKKSTDKVSVGGRKFALRRLNDAGIAELEMIGIGAPPSGDHNDRELLVPLVTRGEIVGEEPLEAARERHVRSRRSSRWRRSRCRGASR